jgi:hypothetical protein
MIARVLSPESPFIDGARRIGEAIGSVESGVTRAADIVLGN